MGVLDDIKANSAFNLVEVEVEAELGNIMLTWPKQTDTRTLQFHICKGYSIRTFTQICKWMYFIVK